MFCFSLAVSYKVFEKLGPRLKAARGLILWWLLASGCTTIPKIEPCEFCDIYFNMSRSEMMARASGVHQLDSFLRLLR